jgi:hypothetical protein
VNRAISGVAAGALVLGALGGYLGSIPWSGWRQLDDAMEKNARLQQQLEDLRVENDRLGAELKGERTHAATLAGDLHRERDTNMRLQMLLSDGRK